MFSENEWLGAGLRRLREDPQDVVGKIAGDIGPRKPTSLAEAKAAAYLDGRLRRAGMHVFADTFLAPMPLGAEGPLLALLAVISSGLYFWWPIPSLFLMLWVLGIAVGALGWSGGPLLARRRLSQNVIATRAAAESPRWRVVLLAPLDSPPAWGRFGQILCRGARAHIGRVVAGLLLLVLMIIGMQAVDRIWWYAQIPVVLYLIMLAVLDIQTARREGSPGAASHAGALAVLLGSAESLGALEHTELWVVALGATASGAGLADLLRRYPFDPKMTLFVGIESIGRGALCFADSEMRIGPQDSDALLVGAAAAANAAEQTGALVRRCRQVPTIAGALQHLKRRALTIICLGANGEVPGYGSSADIPDSIDLTSIERAEQLVGGMLRYLDEVGG